MTFIQHAGILQRIQISQFCFFGEDLSTNPKDLAGSFCTFWDEKQKSTYHTRYLNKYWTKLHQFFSISRLM